MTDRNPGAPGTGIPDHEGRKEPLFGGLLVDNSLLGRPGELYVKGSYFLNRTQSADLIKLFFDTARFLGNELPPNLIFEAGEIYYENQRVAELRFVGRYLSKVDYDGSVEYSMWVAGPKPRFEVRDGTLVINEEDRGRPHVAALKINSPESGPSVLLSFDVEPHARQEPGPGTRLQFIALGPRGVSDEDAEGRATTSEDFLLNSEELLREVPASGLKDFLTPEPTVEFGEMQTVVAFGGARRLVYSYDVEELRYELATRYAKSADISEEGLEALAREQGITISRAKVMTLLFHLRARDEFVKKGLESYDGRCANPMSYALNTLLQEEILSLELSEFVSPGLAVSPEPEAVKKNMVGSATKAAIRRTGVKKKKRGPRVGSKSKKDAEKISQENAEREEWILEAIRQVYKDEEKRVGSFEVESAITVEKVAVKIKTTKNLRCSRTTLHAWLRKARISFKILKNRVIREFEKDKFY